MSYGFFKGPRPRFDGANVLITGASSGLGAEFARQLAPRARSLILVARREKRLAELKLELERLRPGLLVQTIACDISQPGELGDLLARASGGVDILVNNAGLGDFAQLEDAEWPKVEQMIQVNILALTRLTQALIGPMISRGHGGVLMVGSSSGFQTMPGVAAYSATKYYVRGLTDALRAELRPLGVAVTHLCPGPVATEFADVAFGSAKLRLPGFVHISAARCVREALAGFERGKAVVIPDASIKLLMLVQSLAPRFVLRWFVTASALIARPHLKQLAAEKQAKTPRRELTATQH